jgi:protein LTV1
VPREDDVVEDKEYLDDLRTKMLALNEKHTRAADGYDSNDDRPEEEEAWDCESILSTYTNTDNHPGVIRTTKRIRANKRGEIALGTQFRVPLDGLMPQGEIILAKKEKAKATNAKTAFEMKAQDSEEVESEEMDEDEACALNPKKVAKKAQKAEQAEKRKLKKELKQAFKLHNGEMTQKDVKQIGELKNGVSVKKIY